MTFVLFGEQLFQYINRDEALIHEGPQTGGMCVLHTVATNRREQERHIVSTVKLQTCFEIEIRGVDNILLHSSKDK